MESIHTPEDRIEDRKNLLLYLTCPYCGCQSGLDLNAKSKLSCSNESCSQGLKTFQDVLGQPLLINFNSSLFSKGDYCETQVSTVMNRNKSNVYRSIRKAFKGTNKKAEANSKIFLKALKEQNSHPTILIVGGGAVGQGSNALYQDPDVKLISFDVYPSMHTDFIADAHSIPIKSESIDGVWIQAVLEHVLEPHKAVSEIHRVLKLKGIVYAETPFMQQVHEQAYDFTRFTESGHRWLFKDFELMHSGSVAGPATVLAWSIRYFFSSLFRSKLAGKISGIVFFWLRFLDEIMPETYASDGASGVFFMGKKTDNLLLPPSEIIDFYRGVS